MIYFHLDQLAKVHIRVVTLENQMLKRCQLYSKFVVFCRTHTSRMEAKLITTFSNPCLLFYTKKTWGRGGVLFRPVGSL